MVSKAGVENPGWQDGPLRTLLTVPVYFIGTSPMITLGSLWGPVEECPGGGTIPGGYVVEKEGPVDR